MMHEVKIDGRLGRDPESRWSGSGMQICNFSIASGYKVKDEWVSEWHNVVAFDDKAEIAEKFNVGDLVEVSGYVKLETWTDKEGEIKKKFVIVANTLSVKRKGNGSDKPANDAKAYSNARNGRPAQSIADLEDDVPF